MENVEQRVKKIVAEQLGRQRSRDQERVVVRRRPGRGFARYGRVGDGAGRRVRNRDPRRGRRKNHHRAAGDRLRRLAPEEVASPARAAASGIGHAPAARQSPRASGIRPLPVRSSTINSMSRRRVVVTGMGIVSPVGIGLAAAWDNILAAARASPRSRASMPAPFRRASRARSRTSTSRKYLSGKDARRYDTFVHYGQVATMEAVKRRRARWLWRRPRASRRLHRLGHRRPADDRGHAQRLFAEAARARSRLSSCRDRSST